MDAMVPDSAATAFSMYSGVKSNTFTMGYDTNIKVSQSAGRISFLLQFVFPIKLKPREIMISPYFTNSTIKLGSKNKKIASWIDSASKSARDGQSHIF